MENNALDLAYEGIFYGQKWDIVECVDEAAWLKARSEGVGASESGGLLGLSPYSSAFSLFTEKRSNAPRKQNARMLWGSLVEPAVAELARRALGVDTLVDLGRYTMLRSRENPRLQATLDRICPSLSGYQGAGVVELKHTSVAGVAETPPDHYQCQVQHQLAVTGLQWGVLAVVHEGVCFLHMIDRNEQFIKVLNSAVRDFWAHMEAGFAPSPDASRATSEALRHLRENEATITINAAAIDDELQAIKAKQSELTKQRDKLEERLIALIGSASCAKIDGTNVEYRFTTTNRPGHVVKPSSSRVLRRHVAKGSMQ